MSQATSNKTLKSRQQFKSDLLWGTACAVGICILFTACYMQITPLVIG